VTAGQRPCQSCGTIFTWTPASPRQRYCSIRCRQAWWAARRRQATAALNHGGIALPAAQPRAGGPCATALDGRGVDVRSHDGPGTLAATPACPHCKQPVAIVAWLVPPAAATVTTPPRHAVTTSDNQ